MDKNIDEEGTDMSGEYPAAEDAATPKVGVKPPPSGGTAPTPEPVRWAQTLAVEILAWVSTVL